MKNKEEVLLKLSNNQQIFQLALADNIRKQYDDVMKARQEGYAEVKKASTVGANILTSAKSLRMRAEQFLKDYERFSITAKTAGLEIPANMKGLDAVVKNDLKIADSFSRAGNTIQGLAK